MEGLRTSQQAALLSATDPRALTLVYRFLLAKPSRPPFSSPQAPRPPPRLRSPAPGNRARHCTARRRRRRRRRWPPRAGTAAVQGCAVAFLLPPGPGARLHASTAVKRRASWGELGCKATHCRILVPGHTHTTCTTRYTQDLYHASCLWSLALSRAHSHFFTQQLHYTEVYCHQACFHTMIGGVSSEAVH